MREQMKRRNMDVYNEVGSEIVCILQTLDRSGSMAGPKFDAATNAFNKINEWIYDDESLYSSALVGFGVFGNQPQLVYPLSVASDHDIDFSKYTCNEMTALNLNYVMTGNYLLKAARDAQKVGKTPKGMINITYTDGYATDPENYAEALSVHQKLHEKHIITIAVAIDQDGTGCDYNALKSLYDYVFRLDELDQLEKFMKQVPLQLVSIVSQSVTGTTFTVNGTTITGTAEVGAVEDSDIDISRVGQY